MKNLLIFSSGVFTGLILAVAGIFTLGMMPIPDEEDEFLEGEN